MPKITIREAMQDETFFFNFILNNPKHGLVLNLINGAIKTLSKDLHSAVQQRDIAKQSALHSKCKFLSVEAHDRVFIYEEHGLADALQWVHGADALKAVRGQQTQSINEWMAKLRLEMNFTQSPIEKQLWEAGVFGNRPAWDVGDGKANTSIACALRARRARIFQLSIAITAAFNGNQRVKARELKLQLDTANKEMKFLSDLGFRTSIYKTLKDIYGQEASREIADIMEAHSKIGELRQIRNQCQENQYKGRLFLSAKQSEFKPQSNRQQRNVAA